MNEPVSKAMCNGCWSAYRKFPHGAPASCKCRPRSHANITGIDTRTALKMPSVHVVLTGADCRADGLGPLPSPAPYKRRGGSPMYLPPRPAIAFNRVMHVGYPVAVVVADAPRPCNRRGSSRRNTDCPMANSPTILRAPVVEISRPSKLEGRRPLPRRYLPGALTSLTDRHRSSYRKDARAAAKEQARICRGWPWRAIRARRLPACRYRRCRAAPTHPPPRS